MFIGYCVRIVIRGRHGCVPQAAGQLLDSGDDPIVRIFHMAHVRDPKIEKDPGGKE
jgi:hypothetical protein